MCCCQENATSRATSSKRARIIESRVTAFLEVVGADVPRSAKMLPSDDFGVTFNSGMRLNWVDNKPHYPNFRQNPHRTTFSFMTTVFLDCLPLLFSMITINRTHTSILKECFPTILLHICSTSTETFPLISSNENSAILCAVLCHKWFMFST